MRRRRGITLIEVLVAIFIMAIGLLAILTLFPLGAMRMAQALQADRDASAASAAANMCDAFGIRTDPQYDPPVSGTNSLFATPPPPPPGMPNLGLPPATAIGQGFPVYVDPYGVANNSGTLGYSNATSPATPGIWRVAPTVIPPPYSTITPNLPNPPTVSANPGPTAARYFTLPDDITFADNGLPDLSTSFVQRGGRYTYGLLLRRLSPYSPSSPVDLTVVVYSGRATAVAGGENTYPASGNPSDTAASVSYTGTQPNIRRGSWILDTSYNVLTGSVHGDFYRVVSVTQPSAGVLNLELQIPLAKPLSAVTVLDNVVDVFERGTDDSTRWEFRNEP